MDSEYFSKQMVSVLRNTCIEGIIRYLEKVPGRKPHLASLQMSEWYNQSSNYDKKIVEMIVKKATDQALFSFFCIMDHVSFIEDTEEKTTFELYAVKDGVRTLLNDPKQEELHNLYNSFSREEDANLTT